MSEEQVQRRSRGDRSRTGGSSEAPDPSVCGSLGAEDFDSLRGALGPALDTGDRPHVPVLRISLPRLLPPTTGKPRGLAVSFASGRHWC